MNQTKKNKLRQTLFKLSTPEEKAELALRYSQKNIGDSVELAKYIKNLEKRVMDSLTRREQVTTQTKKDIIDLVDAFKFSIGQELEAKYGQYLSSTEEMKGLVKSFYEVHENMRKEFEGKTVSTRKSFKKKLDEIMVELERIGNGGRPNSWGGSSRTFYLNGTPASTRYSDVNFIAGTGITFSEVDNETTLRADVTVTASGSSGLTAERPSGTIDGSNRVFTVQNQTKLLFLNGAYQTPSVDYVLTGSSAPYTITYTYAPTVPSSHTSLY
jgi:hypothetical protein